MTTKSLLALGERIERLATDGGDRTFLDRLERPLLRAVRWKPKVRITKQGALYQELGSATATNDALERAYLASEKELAANVETIERLIRFAGRVPTAHANWLRRSYELCFRARRAMDAMDPTAGRVVAARASTISPPLGTQTPSSVTDSSEKHDEAEEDRAYSVALPSFGPGDARARAVEIELAAIDHLLDAARAEGRTIDRKRKLLTAARERLLDAHASTPLDGAAVKDRRVAITRDLIVLDRLTAAGLSTRTSLLYQARQALAQGDRAKLYAALRGMDEAALGQGDESFLARSTAAISQLDGSPDPLASVGRSAQQTFGDAVLGAVRRGYQRGRASAATQNLQPEHAIVRYFAEGRETDTLANALAVDACFELGGPMSPVRIEEEERRLRIVPHPTPTLHLVAAHSVEDISHAVVSDPRSVLLDLAAGRLLARRYVQDERIVHTRKALATEVRFFVLDGSGSMLGARSRMRDAMLVAELSTLAARLAKGGFVRPRLLYRYFDVKLGPLTRVTNEAEALDAIERSLAETHDGGTDIEGALLSSFAAIKAAQATDPDLARAQIVLVTDGDAPIDQAKLMAAREDLGNLPVGVSVVALGTENAALRELVRAERTRGRSAFYHFVSDDELTLLSSGGLTASFSMHLREEDLGKSRAEIASDLSSSVGALVEELAELERSRDVARMEQVDLERRSLHELGCIGDPTFTDGDRARFEASESDERALRNRFTRWFGSEGEGAAASISPEATTELPESMVTVAENVRITLAAVAEIVELVGGSELERQAEAIELFERLLPDAGVSPAEYQTVLRAVPPGVKEALSELRRVTRPT